MDHIALGLALGARFGLLLPFVCVIWFGGARVTRKIRTAWVAVLAFAVMLVVGLTAAHIFVDWAVAPVDEWAATFRAPR
jgi:hypothetical protein